MNTTETIDPKYDISAEGRNLVKGYQHSVDEVERTKNAYYRAQTDEANARLALIKWCSPKDAKAGEKFGIWSRDQYGNEVLIEAQTEYADPIISGSDATTPTAVRRHEGTIKLRYRK